SRPPDRRAAIIARIKPSSPISCTKAGSHWPPIRAAISACGASAIAGSISTSASTCRRPCTRGAASIDQHFPSDPLRALSRLAQGAGFLPRAAGRSAARADRLAYRDGDLFRILALHNYGGVYADMDTVLLRSLGVFLDQEFVYQWDRFDDVYAPALMRLRQGSAFAEELIRGVIDIRPGKYN